MKIEVKILIIFLFVFSACENKPVDPGEVNTDIAIYDNPTNKLWFHRANTIKIAQESLTEYSGVEFDVVFDASKKQFDIRHDVDGTPSEINLEMYFDSIPNSDEYYYWMDFKNLNSENSFDALDRLTYVLNKFHLLDKLFVESTNASALGVFSNAEIYTCYWVSYVEAPYDYSSAKETQISIRNNLQKYEFNAISGHYTNYTFLNEFFPNSNIHLWTNGLISEDDKEVILELASNSNVKVILVDYEEDFEP